MQELVKLLRPQQWYKNVMVFIAIVFSGNALNVTLWIPTLLAFCSLCAISSASYVINDIVDRKRDRLNPEKRNRPIASGKVCIFEAIILFCILLLIGLGIALLLPKAFLLTVLILFVLSQLYTIALKYEAFADIITISINFVLRAVAGAVAIGVVASTWLIADVFFLSLFLMAGKRKGELFLLKGKAKKHRSVLSAYTKEVTGELSIIATTALIICYTLFVFFGKHPLLFLTLPVALYAIIRYSYLISIGSKIARHPELVLTDKRMLISMLLWCAITFFVLYF